MASSRATWALIVVAVLWFVFVLSRYYVRVLDFAHWRTFDWAMDMSSLSFVRALPDLRIGDLEFWSYPALVESVARGAASVGGALLVLGAADGIGRLILRRFRWETETAGVRTAFRVSVGLALLSVAARVLYAVGWFSAPIVLVVTLPFAVFTVVTARREVRRRSESAATRSRSLWVVPALLVMALAFVIALAPETEYDAVWYHLGLPRTWLDMGGLWTSPTESVSLYPMSWELIYSLAMSIGGPGAAKLVHFATLPLTALTVVALSRRLTPRVPPWLPAAIFMTIPTVFWEATTAYVDLALVFSICLAAYGVIRYVDSRRVGWLWLAALNLGLALATKHLALMAAVPIVIGLIGAVWRRDGRAIDAVKPTLILLSGLALALPWYARSFIESGNPVFPQMFSVFGSRPEWWDATTEAGLAGFLSRFGRPRTLPNLVTLPWDVTIHGSRYGGSVGPLLLLLIPASLTSKLTPAARWVGVLTLAYIGLWASPLGQFQLRFLLPALPFLSLFAAQGAWAISDWLTTASAGRGVRFAGVSLALLMALNLPPFLSIHETDRNGWDGWLTHVVHDIPMSVIVGIESEQDYLTRKLPTFGAWQAMADVFDESSYVLNFTDEDRLHSTASWVAAHATPIRDAVNGSATMTAIEAFDAHGLTHMMVSRELLGAAGELPAILQPDVLAEYFEPIHEDQRIVVYHRMGQRTR